MICPAPLVGRRMSAEDDILRKQMLRCSPLEPGSCWALLTQEVWPTILNH